jgi:hypothetical protein
MQERKPGCICELDTETGEPLVANYAECPVHKPDAILPKDAAKRLVYKFYSLRPIEIMDDEAKKVAWGVSKLTANICVDELLSVLEPFQRHEYAKVLIPYYNEVKKEIQNL